ncbi:bifunctional biotin--[acetyl-CoA-carboxylase] ligase/biotin operon repressor BirA [Nitrincola alkalilacustris]|uniref:bifunctional biotin--[acetyl-CoA-carboxylase] ligase/biotin operon repressor BirA n=1 Tax=Nitrincola alkalilacustris TaxID=1571224 RepID=UPI00124E384E|nr:bifunctional biotin--[acetyl-CoA-carboxylase] ligase/biotin operon repressor BirA [Nitrincola alkalilacustris]
MVIKDLLSILADGTFHSGRELGERLGISRSAVWKQVQSLAALDIEVYSVRGRGYRIPRGLDLMDQALFDAALTADVRDQLDLQSFSLEVTSTNHLASAALAEGIGSGIFVAERQTAGRGRRGRSWISPFGANIYFSIGWRLERGVAALEGLSLAVGIALRDALTDLGVPDVMLKWPNDLLCKGQKLAGVLIEVNGDTADQCQLILGIGLNVGMPEQSAQQIDQPWTDLHSQMANPPSRNLILAALVNRLIPMLNSFEQQGFSALHERWAQVDAYYGRAVEIHAASTRLSGICRGVNETGALLLETDRGMETVHGGEVSLRLQS